MRSHRRPTHLRRHHPRDRHRLLPSGPSHKAADNLTPVGRGSGVDANQHPRHRHVPGGVRTRQQAVSDETSAASDHLHTFLANTTRADQTPRLLGLVTDARRDLFLRTCHSLDRFLATIDAAAEALADATPSAQQVANHLWLLLHRAEAAESLVNVPTRVLDALARTGSASRALSTANKLPSSQ